MRVVIHSSMPGRRPGTGLGGRLAPEQVHKASAAEVLLAGVDRLGENHFSVAALWPRNGFLGHSAERVTADPLLLAETVRQCAIVLSHRFHGVPAGHRFVLCEMDFGWEGPMPAVGDRPLPVELDIRCAATVTGPHRFGMRLDAVFFVDGRRRARAGLRWEVLTPRRYAALRSRRRSAAEAGTALPPGTAGVPLPPMAVGYRDERDVLLSALPGTDAGWLLRLDRSHPVLFDHENDHISGMTLLEAFRQAALVAPGGAPLTDPAPRLSACTSADASFTAFAELDEPVVVTATGGPAGEGARGVLGLSAVQGGRTLATALVRRTAWSPLTTGGIAC